MVSWRGGMVGYWWVVGGILYFWRDIRQIMLAGMALVGCWWDIELIKIWHVPMFRAVVDFIISQRGVKAMLSTPHPLMLPGCSSPEFDSNVITPGTPFMERLADYLRVYIHAKIDQDPGWRDIKVRRVKTRQNTVRQRLLLKRAVSCLESELQLNSLLQSASLR